jgi:precorrin-6B methylase 2
MRFAAAWKALAVGTVLASASIAQDGVRERQRPKRARRIPDVMYIPTPHDVVERMLQLAAVRKDDVLYDLGCGDGRIVVAAAKRYGCRAVGVDIDPLRVRDARRNVRENHVEHLVTIKEGDLFKVDLSEATVVTLYLSTRYNEKLLPQLSRMRPGSRVVSHRFGMKTLEPDKVVRVRSREGRWSHPLLLWDLPPAPVTK